MDKELERLQETIFELNFEDIKKIAEKLGLKFHVKDKSKLTIEDYVYALVSDFKKEILWAEIKTFRVIKK